MPAGRRKIRWTHPFPAYGEEASNDCLHTHATADLVGAPGGDAPSERFGLREPGSVVIIGDALGIDREVFRPPQNPLPYLQASAANPAW